MRPWVLLFKEPIVSVLSIYMAIIYGTLYMLFGAFPICIQEARGWSEGIGGLAFLGVTVGMVLAIMLVPLGNRRYVRAASRHGGIAPPEARLIPAMAGAIAIPLGLFWFAWTNYPSIHWISSVMAGAPFGFGMVLVFLAVTNYLVDVYGIYTCNKGRQWRKDKDRITLALTCNADGSEKFEPWIIGKSKNPCCLKGINFFMEGHF